MAPGARDNGEAFGRDGERVAVGPISWGVCEVPGWGVQLPPEHVLGEIASVGVTAVEAGPVGYLGADAQTVTRTLGKHGLRLVGGFVPVVLHDRAQREESLADAARIAELYAAAGGDVLVSALPVDRAWSPPRPLGGEEWAALVDGLSRLDEMTARWGLRHALHPHVGTLVQTAAELDRVLETSDVGLCLDTGHLLLGGADPARLAREAAARVVHVHLKDVHADVAAELHAGSISLVDATRRGLFCPLGDGDAPIEETVRALAGAGYGGWYVIEQDTTVAEDAPPEPGRGPLPDTIRSIAFLDALGLGPLPGPGSREREVSASR